MHRTRWGTARCPRCRFDDVISVVLGGRCFSGEGGKKPAFPSWVRFSFLFVCDSPVFVNDDRPAFKCSGCFQSHLNRFLKTSVGELVLPFLPFETADFLENL